MNIPSREECLKLFEKYHVPENIQLHCKTVNKVGVFLAKLLKEKEVEVDIDLVDRLTLTHDLMKANSFELIEEPEFKCYPTEEQIVFWREFREKKTTFFKLTDEILTELIFSRGFHPDFRSDHRAFSA